MFLLNVNSIMSQLGIYTGASCCIVKLPDEVCVGHTKRVGEINKNKTQTAVINILNLHILIMT